MGASEEGNLELWLRKTIKTRRSEGLSMTEQEGWDFPSNRETGRKLCGWAERLGVVSLSPLAQ